MRMSLPAILNIPAASDSRREQALALLIRFVVVVGILLLAGMQFRNPELDINLLFGSGFLLFLVSLLGGVIVYFGQVTIGLVVTQLLQAAVVVYMGLQFQNTESVLLAMGLCMTTLTAVAAPEGQRRRWIWVSCLFWLFLLGMMITLPVSRRILPAAVRNGLTASPLMLGIPICLPALRNFRNFPLRVKLMLLIVGLIETAIVVVATVNGVALTNALIEEYGRDTVQTAEAEAQEIALLLIEEVNLLNTLSVDDLLRQKLPAINESYTGSEGEILAELEELDQRWRAAEDDEAFIISRLQNDVSGLLRAFQAKHPDNVEIFVTDKFGGLLASTGRTTDYYQADEAWWENSFAQGQGNFYIGELEFDTSSNSLGFNMATPIWNEQRTEILGILRTTYLPTNLDDLLSAPIVAEREGRALLLIGQQEVYVEEDNTLILTDQSLQTNNVRIELIGNPDRYVVRETGNGDLETASTALIRSNGRFPVIDALNWQVIVYESLDDVFDIIARYGQMSVAVTSATLIILLFVVYRFSQSLLGPIADLTDMTARVRDGDISGHTDIQSGDELGQLSMVFNEMVSQMQQAFQTVESRVAERVQALETSSMISQKLVGILNIEQLAQGIVTQIQESFDYYHVQMFTIDMTMQELRLIAASGEMGHELLESRPVLALEEGSVGRVAVVQSAILTPNLGLQPSLKTAVTLPETVAELAMPILLENELLAILSVQEKAGQRLDYRDVELLQLLLSQVAITIRNVRQYVYSQERIAQEQQLNDFRQQILQTTSIDDALQVAAESLGKLLGADGTTVQLSIGAENGSGD